MLGERHNTDRRFKPYLNYSNDIELTKIIDNFNIYLNNGITNINDIVCEVLIIKDNTIQCSMYENLKTSALICSTPEPTKPINLDCEDTGVSKSEI